MNRAYLVLFLGLGLCACSPVHSGDPAAFSDLAGGGQEPPPVTGFKLNCEEARFVTLLNLYRKQAQNLNAVTVSIAGVKAARWHANDMGEKGYMGHTEPNGRDYISRMAAFGFGGWAENAAAGVYTGQDAFCLWKNSPGHNSNMLGAHQSIGLGMAEVSGSQYGAYWSNGFGPAAADIISPPLTVEVGCPMPSSLPGC